MNTYSKQTYTSTTPQNQGFKDSLYPQNHPQILQNHIIVNINENKNINNFYNMMEGIQGRKMDDDKNIIRMGRNETETNSSVNLDKGRGIKTMISKKLLNQAKTAKQKSQRLSKPEVSYKTSRAAPTVSFASNSNAQTQRQERKRNKSGIDFHMLTSKMGVDKNVTIDYEKRNSVALNQSTQAMRNTMFGQKNEISSRRKSNPNSMTLPKSSNRQKQQGAMKSSRPLAQAKLTNNFVKHKRVKSDIKKGYQTQKAVTGAKKAEALVNQQNLQNISKFSNTRRSNVFEDNMQTNSQNFSQERPHSNHLNSVSANSRRVNNKSQYVKNEGMSISSFSSNDYGANNTSARNYNKQEGDSIAQQLSRTYFLNTKQLLRHLSPNKERKLEVDQQNISTVRGRSRSSGPNSNNQTANANADRRKSHSHSHSRAKNQTAMVTLKNNNAMASIIAQGGHISGSAEIADQRAINSKSMMLGAAPPGPQTVLSSLGATIKKGGVDKLIKKNLKKNQTKNNETLARQQLEEYRQQKRREDLSQRNKELRQINASKVISTTNKESGLGNVSTQMKTNLSLDKGVLSQAKYRSQSCNETGGTSVLKKVADRQPNRSQDKQFSENFINDISKLSQPLQTKKPVKQVPLTTTNQASAGQDKQRSFVDEITQLTHQVQRELGLTQSNNVGRQTNNFTAQTKQAAKIFLNETADGIHDKTALTSFLNDAKPSQKRSKKRDKMSYKIQRFIENKKRENGIKKYMEQTIEVEKAIKIQNNLNNLDLFVKKHLRQKSTPLIGQKKSSIVNGIFQGELKKQKKLHKKNQPTLDPRPILGLSEIFYPQFTNHSQHDMDDFNDPNQTVQEVSHGRYASQNASITDQPDLSSSVINTAGRAHKSAKAKPTSNKQKKNKKSQIKESSAGAWTASGSAANTNLRKSTKVDVKRTQLNPSKQTSVPLPINQVKPDAQRVPVSKFNTSTQPLLPQKQLPNSIEKQSQWLRHPDENKNPQLNQIPTNSDFNQTIPLSLSHIDSMKNRSKMSDEAKKSLKSSGKIRRIHELVSLYRCKFKPNTSDASIIGTLHSAASVIQIHFRYRKHLRDAQQVISEIRPTIDSSIKRIQNQIGVPIPLVEESQEYSVSQKNRKGSKVSSKRTSGKEKLRKQEDLREGKQVIKERLDFTENFEGLMMGDAPYDGQFKEVRGSVFNTSEIEDLVPPPPVVPIEDFKSPKELKFKRNHVQLIQQTSKERMSDRNKDNRDSRKHNKLSLMLDIEQITNEHENNTQQSQELNTAFAIGGNKTPQIPGLDLKKLQSRGKKNFDFQEEEKVEELPYIDQPASKEQRVEKDTESQVSQVTVSSYRGLFNRMGLPLPRSARVKVDYDLVERDPKITEQLKEIVKFKDQKGKQVLEEGRKESLISERTFQVNVKRLEKWVNSNYRKIGNISGQRSRTKPKAQTHAELIKESEDERNRLQRLMPDQESSRQASHMSQSWRASGLKNNDSNSYYHSYRQSNKGETFTDRDPYKNVNDQNKNANQVQVLGSGRQQQSKLIELIQGDTSRTSQKNVIAGQMSSDSRKQLPDSSSYEHQEQLAMEDSKDEDISLKLDEINLEEIEDRKPLQNNFLLHRDGGSPTAFIQTEKSLNRSISHPAIHNNDNSEEKTSKGLKAVDPSDIELQLEDELENQKKMNQERQGGLSKQNQAHHTNLEDIRDPRFFIKQVEDESLEDNHQLMINFSKVQQLPTSNSVSEQESEKQQNSPSIEEILGQPQVLYPVQRENAIKVENQLHQVSTEYPLEIKNVPPFIQTGTLNLPENNLSSPLSDGQTFEFNKIQTGAHSLSSTDSDMQKAIRSANQDNLQSPPNLTSPKNQLDQLIINTLAGQKQSNEPEKFKGLADDLTDFIFAHLIREINEEIPILVPRPQLMQQQRAGPAIKFFDKKGIKTDLFAIEKYVDEVMEEVKQNREEFMVEVNRAVPKNPMESLFLMQNSEIGSYEHFQSNSPSVLSLDLYLKLEKRRKESRDNPNALKPGSPDGGFDFDRIDEEELKGDGVNKNFLAECQHIHNKVLFDCINDSLQQFRPNGKDGTPTVWSTVGRKLKPTEDFSLEEMFEITKHDLFRMAIMQAGTLPRREFVFNNAFDDELFAEIREKKLATLLCREIVETEPSWLKWEFEEAQTKIDIGDMVLESLVTEVIDFLQTKSNSNPQNSAQANFEQIQKMLASRE